MIIEIGFIVFWFVCVVVGASNFYGNGEDDMMR